MEKVLFSQVSVCPQGGEGVPGSLVSGLWFQFLSWGGRGGERRALGWGCGRGRGRRGGVHLSWSGLGEKKG